MSRSPTTFSIFLPKQNLFSLLVFTICCLTASTTCSNAQRPIYKITATIDTFGTDTVKGTIDITWTNRSGSPLDKLGIHLWPNAYSNKNTALVKQMLDQGDVTVYRAPLSDLGGLYDLNFTSSGANVKLTTDENNIDIGWLQLNQPLNPYSTIHLSSPYTLIIPKSFSRIGRTGDSYQLTQWYPHIAVYDTLGWHTMPYLNQGEYYNDFADYEVSISVPERYKVAATGVLQSTAQKGKLIEWNFKADNVIDFAWFASPTFRHETLKVDVGLSEPVELNVYIDSWLNTNWKSAVLYAERALKFYSDWIGPYPYPQMSVVYTPFSKAGYMEYPMVAQISYTEDPVYLDRVIAHEIGHTWLYGILANDERTNPWLDEGFNSFMEEQYMKTYYQDAAESIFPKVFESKKSMDDDDALQHFVRFNGDLQPPLTPPEHQTENQYLFSAYLLPEEGLDMMMSMVGPVKMKQMFRKYFEDRKFTHVAPSDVQASFEKACNCDCSWFFKGWLHHAHEVDYRIKKFDADLNNVTIENHGTPTIPVEVSGYLDGTKINQQWVDGFAGEKAIHFDKHVDEVRLYDGMMAINKNWTDNIHPRQIKVGVSIFPKIANYTNPVIGFTPVIGHNLADGLMPGLALTSGLMPQHGFKWFFMPMYGIDSKEFRYYGEARYIKTLEHSAFDKLMISVAASSFGYNIDTHYVFRDHFFRLSPSLALRFNADDNIHLTRWLKYRYVDITQNYGRGLDYEAKEYESDQRHYGIHELEYEMSSDVALKPFNASANIQAGKGFVRLNVNYNQHFVGKNKQRGVWVHGFAGWLPYFEKLPEESQQANVLFSFNGTSSNGYLTKDYMLDEWLGGRNATDGLYSRQLFMKDAELKTLDYTGLSEKWMIAGGASVALPFKFVHFYMDATLYPSAITDEVTFSYSGGMSVILLKDVIEIYVPILESKDIRESIAYTNREMWFDRISFQANIKLFNPLNLIDRYQLKYQ